MNRYMKFLTVTVLLIAALLITGCGAEQTPYELNDGENFTISVKYDANGGIFTTNTSVIVDSYNPDQLPMGSDGSVNIALLPPDDPARGNDAFAAVNNGYFLAGWYTQRTETEEGYVYSGLWDFENGILSVDPETVTGSAEPVVTLYAAWVPLFEVEFYDLDSGEYMSSYTFNPLQEQAMKLPALDEETGAVELYDFPENPGHTYEAAYLDAAGTQPVATEMLTHTGTVDYETGTAKDHVMQVYVKWQEGEWFHIYNVEQFLDNASVSGSYVLHADLDFTDEIWPSSMMYGNFSGTIEGNGYTIRNVSIEQTNNSKVNAGLFGSLTEEAKITDLNLENVTFTIKSGTRVMGTSYGLFAGSVSTGTQVSNVTIANSCLQVDSGCYFGTDDYAIGLVCGMGNPGIDPAGITTAAVGSAPESVVLTVTDETVTVEFVTE